MDIHDRVDKRQKRGGVGQTDGRTPIIFSKLPLHGEKIFFSEMEISSELLLDGEYIFFSIMGLMLEAPITRRKSIFLHNGDVFPVGPVFDYFLDFWGCDSTFDQKSRAATGWYHKKIGRLSWPKVNWLSLRIFRQSMQKSPKHPIEIFYVNH